MVAQASWLDSDDLELDTGSEDGAEELWHVMLAPDEVKVLTLEQLDDLFRLDIIDAGTPVWQPATMSSWTTLGSIAGIDEDGADSIPAALVASGPRPGHGRGSSSDDGTVSLRALPPAPRTGAPPPSSRLERYDHAAPSTQSVTPPMLHVVRPPAPPPAPKLVRAPSAPPPYAAPKRTVQSAYPPPVSAVGSYPPPVAPTASALRDTQPPRSASRAAPVYAAPAVETLRPMAADIPVPAPRRRGGIGVETWLVGLAAMAGLAVTLYRNDTLRATARDTGREPLFAQLETALGGPSFGTMRAIEELRPAAASAVQTSATAPAPRDSTTHVAETKPAADGERNGAAKATEPASAPAPKAADPAPSLADAAKAHVAAGPTTATDPAKNAVRLEDLGQAPTGNQSGSRATAAPAETSRPSPRTAARAAASRPAKAARPATASPAPVKRSKQHASSMYDPLNPEL